MKLKKLEIIGFKSFFDKATIEFPPGISAVVGPNGCGKSNIIDALRWVMGEQSVKQLRGKAMEDIIFSGANGTPPLGMAEVSLTIANENGDAPEELRDFTEIMLTRRLYRSGESAYFLNKQPCRLKDIHNIFLGSGMGTRSYSVIQQGNIGAITEAGPEERRYFIEEAAGVTRYKSRKNEALRKVEMTNQNLLRVSDIITEIKRQMASLKRQARKAEIYNNYQKRIKILDLLLSQHYYDDYTRQIDQSDALMRKHKDLDIEHTSKLKKLDAAVEEIKLRQQQKTEEIAQQKAAKFETQRDIDKMENDLDHLRNEIKRLSLESAELRSARKHLEQKNQEMVSEIAQVEKENAGINDRIDEVRKIIEQERLDSQKVSDQLEKLNQELDAHKAQLMDQVAREAQYKNIYQNAANNKEGLQRRIQRKAEEEALVKQKIVDITRRETEAQSRFSAIKQQIEAVDNQISEVREKLSEKSKALGDQVRIGQALELEHTTAKSKLSTLQKMEDNFEWYRDGVRAVMKAQRWQHQSENDRSRQNSAQPGFNSELSDHILGLMADIIDVEPVYAPAIEAALGESLQYIIVKDQKAGCHAIDYLQSQKAGRSGFIPISSIKPYNAQQPLSPGSAQRLMDHVTVKSGFEKIVQALLGHVVYANDLKEAIEIFNRNGALQIVVTQNGDLISPQGIMIGGSKDRQDGILAKKNELKTLQRQCKNLDKKREKARADQNELEAEVRIFENQLQQLIEKKNNTTKDETEAEKDLYKISEDLKNARQHLEIISLEYEQLLGESSDIDQEMTKFDRALSEISTEISQAQQNVAALGQKITAVTDAMEKFNLKVVDLKLELTSLNAKLENNSSGLRRLRNFYADDQKRLEQLISEIGHKAQKEQASKQTVTEYQQLLAEMYQRMEKLDRALQDNQTDYQTIDAELKDSDTLKTDIQNKREQTLEKFRLLELELSQLKIKRENIVNRIEERYHHDFARLLADLKENAEAGQIQSEMPIEKMETELSQSREKIAKIVDVNLGAIREYEQLKDRFDFLQEQRNDLERAIEDLHKVIKKINKITQERFIATFNLINEKLDRVFPRLFDGGTAKLVLTEPDKPLDTGVELMIHLPGKKLSRLSLLSGGEKALSAIAFIFSIFLIKPASFCLLDEIDAPLDDANIFRFNDLLQIIGEQSQIIMITHNKRTMEFADTLFGITMERKGISKLVAVKLAQNAALN
jgi:chromosome segregation protein